MVTLSQRIKFCGDKTLNIITILKGGLKLKEIEDIIDSNFRLAKNPADQILIDADIYCNGDIDMIKDILQKRGHDVSNYSYKLHAAGFYELITEQKIAFKNNREEEALQLYHKGLSDKEIADKLGVSSMTICNLRKDHNLKCWDDINYKNKCDRIYKLHKKGLTYRQIAEATGEGYQNVINIVNKIKKKAAQSATVTAK